jgi:16S rRNA (cytosine967-C5)-methyltransferase
VSPARRAAFQILLRVETEGAFPAELLHSHPRVKDLTERDRALAHEIVLGCLRWQGAIDARIEPVARRPVADLDAEVRTALRMAVYQMRFLDRIPDRAAVSESVELIKSSPRRGAAGFVNAVLRRLGALGNSAQGARGKEAELSQPAWLVERWR